MKNVHFHIFIKALVSLGYGEVDPELKLWYLFIEGKGDELRNLLSNPGFKDHTYDIRITDTEIVARYQPLIKTAWMQKKINELRAAH